MVIKMVVFEYCSKEEAAGVKLNIQALDFNNVDCDGENFVIPYNDDVFRDEVSGLMDDAASDCDWVIPDYSNAKVTFLIETEADKPHIGLLLEVEPPVWTAKDRKATLDWTSDPDVWQDVFAEADCYHDSAVKEPAVSLYDIRLDVEEMQELAKAIKLHRLNETWFE